MSTNLYAEINPVMATSFHATVIVYDDAKPEDFQEDKPDEDGDRTHTIRKGVILQGLKSIVSITGNTIEIKDPYLSEDELWKGVELSQGRWYLEAVDANGNIDGQMELALAKDGQSLYGFYKIESEEETGLLSYIQFTSVE